MCIYIHMCTHKHTYTHIYYSLSNLGVDIKMDTYLVVTVRSKLLWNLSEQFFFTISKERKNPDSFLGSSTLYLRVA